MDQNRRNLLTAGVAGAVSAFVVGATASTVEGQEKKDDKKGGMDAIPPELVKMAKKAVADAIKATQGYALAGERDKVGVRLEITYPSLKGKLIIETKPNAFNWYANPDPSDPVRCD